MSKILIFRVLGAAILVMLAISNVSAGEVAYIVGDTNMLSADTLFVQRLENHLGYTVSLLDDNAVDTFSNWSEIYDGIFISDLAVSSYVSALKDTGLGIISLDRYTNDEFGFGQTNYRPGGHGRELVNQRTSNHVCDISADTIFPYQYNNQYLYYYGDLAPDAIVPFNTPDFVGHDSACVIMLDSGAVLAGGGQAAGRRVFCGVFRLPLIMDYCHSWQLFDRLVSWALDDTGNVYLKEYQCWGGHLEIDACWCEMTTAQDDSATYNSEFRFGYDLDDILTFWRLIEPERKSSPGYVCDSLALNFPIFTLGLNGTPDDTIMEMKYSAFKIIRDEKWHGPPPDQGGDPYDLDSSWVTRWDIVGGSSPVAWDTLDLRAGVDYDAAALDTFHLDYPADSVGDMIRFVIAGNVFEEWVNDTANNNGLVLKATAVYDSSSNIEYSTRPPLENAMAVPMTIQAWFSASEDSPDMAVMNLVGEGILSAKRRNIIN